MDELRDVMYSGHVQGVGFRATVFRLASRVEVAGFVRNLEDGRVQLVAEGAADQLNLLLDLIAETMAGCIRQTRVDVRPATGLYHGFEIRT